MKCPESIFFVSSCVKEAVKNFQRNFFALCSYHVTYGFHTESTLYSCLNGKELLAQNKREIGSLKDCNGTPIHNYLVCKLTLDHLAKLAVFRPLYGSSTEKESFKKYI